MNRIAIVLCRCLENTFIQTHFRHIHLNTSTILCRKYNLDYSKVPVLHEADIKEQFVNGWGPGGQSVNKTQNCVVLVHQSLGKSQYSFYCFLIKNMNKGTTKIAGKE